MRHDSKIKVYYDSLVLFDENVNGISNTCFTFVVLQFETENVTISKYRVSKKEITV